jgi:hypothetical protein
MSQTRRGTGSTAKETYSSQSPGELVVEGWRDGSPSIEALAGDSERPGGPVSALSKKRNNQPNDETADMVGRSTGLPLIPQGRCVWNSTSLQRLFKMVQLFPL